MPEIEGIDKTGPFKKGSFKCEEDKFLSNIRDAGMDLNKVHTVAGWFDETLTEATKEKLGLEKVRIAHIDVDLYESAKVVLRFLTSLIQEGTILIFDDWFEFAGNPQRGEQKAFYEWLEENPQFQAVGYMCEYPFRNSFIITYRVNE